MALEQALSGAATSAKLQLSVRATSSVDS